MKPLHLCLLGDANSVHLQRWAREMLARGMQVSIVTARPAPIDGVLQQTVLPPVRRQLDWLLRVGAARRAVRALAPDIVHAHYVTSYGYLAARVGRHPLVMTAWGSDLLVTPRHSRLLHALTGWTLRRADVVTGDSADLVDAIAAYLPKKLPQRPSQGLQEGFPEGLPQNRPHSAPLLVHWGVDLARFAPVPWADKPRFDVVSLRNWEPNYRIASIVDGFALLRQRVPAAAAVAHLHVLGGGPMADALRRQVHALGLQGSVTLHGRRDDAGMAQTFARCKVSVSVPVSDATSVSVLESMACGLALVASDLPANRQWLSHQRDLLLHTVDANTVAHALARAWHDDAATAAWAAANHARMLAEGSRALQMDRMAAVYARLAGR